MGESTVRLGVGASVVLDGQAWTVEALEGARVLLANGADFRSVRLAFLVQHGRVPEPSSEADTSQALAPVLDAQSDRHPQPARPTAYRAATRLFHPRANPGRGSTRRPLPASRPPRHPPSAHRLSTAARPGLPGVADRRGVAGSLRRVGPPPRHTRPARARQAAHLPANCWKPSQLRRVRPGHPRPIQPSRPRRLRTRPSARAPRCPGRHRRQPPHRQRMRWPSHLAAGPPPGRRPARHPEAGQPSGPGTPHAVVTRRYDERAHQPAALTLVTPEALAAHLADGSTLRQLAGETGFSPKPSPGA